MEWFGFVLFFFRVFGSLLRLFSFFILIWSVRCLHCFFLRSVCVRNYCVVWHGARTRFMRCRFSTLWDYHHFDHNILIQLCYSFVCFVCFCLLYPFHSRKYASTVYAFDWIWNLIKERSQTIQRSNSAKKAKMNVSTFLALNAFFFSSKYVHHFSYVSFRRFFLSVFTLCWIARQKCQTSHREIGVYFSNESSKIVRNAELVEIKWEKKNKWIIFTLVYFFISPLLYV